MQSMRGPAAVSACGNCGAALRGPFCHKCGQEAAGPSDSLPAFVADALRDTFSFRSRTLRSLYELAVHPGELTAAYFDGRRVRYTKPLQIYLLTAALFFLVNSYRPFLTISPEGDVVSSLSIANAQTDVASEMKAIAESGGSVALFRERFRWTVSRTLPHFMLGSILLFTLALALFSPRRSGLRHLVFALHWTGSFLFIMSFERLLPRLPWPVDLVQLSFVLAVLVHLILSLRRGYGHGWARSVVSGLGLFFCFNVILGLWMMGVIAFALRQLG